MAILTATTGLTNKLALGMHDRLTSSLTISNLRFTDVAVNLELTTQTVNDDLEMQLAHAGNNGLTSSRRSVRTLERSGLPEQDGCRDDTLILSWSAFVLGSTATER